MINLKFIVSLIIAVSSVLNLYGQQSGEFLGADDVLVGKWKFMGAREKSATIAGMTQELIHIEASTFPISTMSFSGAEKQAHPCSTKFSIKKDDKQLYLLFKEACNSKFNSQEDAINYSIGEVKTVRTIEINGKSKDIETSQPILTLVIDGTTYHYETAND